MIGLGRVGLRAGLWLRTTGRFSSVADPYYILGVEKAAQFSEIKKAFYVLAREFHPDKNDSKESQKKFIVIKQAFEAIKMERGMIKPQNLYSSEEQTSMRPNPHKYSTEEEQQHHSFTDYTMAGEKADTREEYSTFNASFRTIKDINEIKFKVEDGEMADPTSRFNLQSFKARISSYSETGYKHYLAIFIGLAFFSGLVSQMYNRQQQEQQESSLHRLTRINQRKTIESDLVQNKIKDLKNIQQNPQFMALQRKEKMQKLKSSQTGQILKDRVIDTSKLNSV